MELEKIALHYEPAMCRDDIEKFNKGFDELPLIITGNGVDVSDKSKLTVQNVSLEKEEKYNLVIGQNSSVKIKGTAQLGNKYSVENVISRNNPAVGIKDPEGRIYNFCL